MCRIATSARAITPPEVLCADAFFLPSTDYAFRPGFGRGFFLCGTVLAKSDGYMDCRFKPGNDEDRGFARLFFVIPGLDPGIHANELRIHRATVDNWRSNEPMTTSRTPIRDPGRRTPPRLLPWAPDRSPGRKLCVVLQGAPTNRCITFSNASIFIIDWHNDWSLAIVPADQRCTEDPRVWKHLKS